MTTAKRVEEFLKEFSDWTFAQDDIKAVALIGSYARHTATETSDVDLVIITTRPREYLQDQRWTRQFGTVEKQQIEDYGLLTSLRVWYMDGPEVEYGITDEKWSALPLDRGTRQVIKDGIRIIFERETILSRHEKDNLA
jgi:predicted nucleotidyltransferase